MNHTIRIEKIIHGGQGLGRLEDGIIVMTPFVLPGEEVIVKERKKQRGYLEAEPVKILQPAADRIDPPCPYYMRCGGCDFQHMNLAAQHDAKETIIRESLNRAKVSVGNNTLRSIIPAPKPFHYRYRIRLKVSPQGEVGFHQAGSNTIIDIEYCHVATEKLNRALNELRGSSFLETVAPDTREIELLHSPSDDRIFCVLHPHKKTSYPEEKLTDHLSSLEVISRVAIKKGRNVVPIARDQQGDQMRQDFDASINGNPYSLTWTPSCFSQVNAEQNATLIQSVCQLAGECKDKEVLDLFCGMGNFSIPLALQGAAITGIERHTQCIAQAKNNASKIGLSDARFFDLDVHKWIRKAAKRSKGFSIVLLDPPRQGMGKDIPADTSH
jgi:23S rRNA (uracil1939-C5)-methyltransferase